MSERQRPVTVMDVVVWVCDKHKLQTFVPGCPECRDEIISAGGEPVKDMEGQWVQWQKRERLGKPQ